MPAQLPRFYIADVHGCANELKSMLKFIEQFAEENAIAPQATLLGDLVDRGPHSMQAVEMAFRVVEKWEGSVAICGNHDMMFATSIDDGLSSDVAHQWLYHLGGDRTLESYTAEDRFNLIIPYIRNERGHHLEFIRAMKPLSVDGRFLATHAGIDPSKPLTEQTVFDLMWIREQFLDHVNPKMPPVIHGHTIMEGGLPVVTENRISLDTGCFATGKLTACFLDPRSASIRFFQATRSSVAEVEPTLLDRGYGTVLDRLGELFDPAFIQ